MCLGRVGELLVIIFGSDGEAFVVEFGEYAHSGAEVVAVQFGEPESR